MRDDRKTQKRARAALNIDLFNSTLLCDKVSLEIAIGALEAHFGNRAADIELLLDDLYPTQYLLEFALSAVCNETFVSVTQRILEKFPTQPESFAPSLACKLIDRFSLYHYFHSYAPSEEPSDLRERRRSAQLSMRALEALLASSFFEEEVGVSGSKVSKRKKSNARPSSDSVSLQSKPFHDLHVDVPRSRQDATRLAEQLLLDLRGILHYYLVVFRYPSLRDHFRNTYIPEKSSTGMAAPESDLPQPAEALPVAGSPAEMLVDHSPAAFREKPYMQMALDTDNTRGLGEWCILISKRAAGDLRQTFKKDPKLFKIIMRKIRDLSNGPSNWTQDNHRHLNVKHETDVPIYAATVTGGSRLIYQVDCIRDLQTNRDVQALRIFAIVTHAQMGEHLWESVGYSLSGRGNEYRRRCVFRNPPTDNVVHPAYFPPLPLLETDSRPSCLPTLHPEHLGKLHELLVLDKYYRFSQALMKSILGGLERSLVFQVSEQEHKIIQHQSSCYVLGRSGIGTSTMTIMLFKMLNVERRWQYYGGSDMRKPRQLFVTKSRVLAEKVKESFSQLKQAHAAADLSLQELNEVATKMNGMTHRLVDTDEIADWQGNLPQRWTNLRDEHFPMFVTYDHLAWLLENDILSDAGQLVGRTPAQRREAFISYDTFGSSYWPHFPKTLTKGLDVTLVFGEFMGIIKGSEEALASDTRYLDRDSYHELKNRRSHAMVVNQADAIYQLFGIYSKMKRERREYDVADRTHRILVHLRDKGVPGEQVTNLYVAEVQDNLLIDLLVLRSLCGNSSGLFWAGDTVQAISVGSTFKFNDFRAFMHRVEASSAHWIEPEFFQLCMNYRSHAGLVNCAQSVVELLTLFWPSSIDSLAHEQGAIDGPKPIFVNIQEGVSDKFEQFGSDDAGIVDFGAKQCVLVRDDAARDRLRTQVGDMGRVFTLYEVKGQEFDDVLLYNFFEDSTVDTARWRVVLNALPEGYHHQAPQFDDIRHSSICHELKCLYVAITRARQKLWIVDNHERFGPMLTFWTARSQIEIWTSGQTLARFATSSTEDEWAKAARTHFLNKHYAQAIHAYEKASRDREKQVAEAYLLREQARNIIDRDLNRGRRSHAFADAGTAFRKSAEAAKAVHAATADSKTYYHNSAQCFRDSGDLEQAANGYHDAEEYTEAALCYSEVGLFDRAVAVIKEHHVRQDEADNIILSAKLHYFKNSKIRKALDLFPEKSLELALDFLEEHALHVPDDLHWVHAKLLEEHGKIAEAAEGYLSGGYVTDAVRLLLKSPPSDASLVRRVEECITEQLWKHISFAVRPNVKKLEPLADLMEKFAQQPHVLEAFKEKASMFLAILRHDLKQLRLLGQNFLHCHDVSAGLLCLDHLFADETEFTSMDYGDAAVILGIFTSYLDTMKKIAEDRNSCHDLGLRRLFGVTYTVKNGFRLSPRTFLHSSAADFGPPSFKVAKSAAHLEISFSVDDLTQLIRRSLQGRLWSRLRCKHGIFRGTHVHSPCLEFAKFGNCEKLGSPRLGEECLRDHSTTHSLDHQSYHMRIQVILSRIVIFQKFRSAFTAEHDGQKLAIDERSFLVELYHAVVPSFLICDAVPTLDASLISNFTEGVHVVKGWIPDLFRSPTSSSNIPWLTVAEVMTLCFFLDRVWLKDHIQSSSLFSHCGIEHLLRGWDENQHDTVGTLTEALKTAGLPTTSFGILYAAHIIDHKLPVDVNTLCDLLEYLCGSLVFLDRIRLAHLMHDNILPHPMHDIALPRGWLLNMQNWKFHHKGPNDYDFISIFLRLMSKLLEDICLRNDMSHLSLDGCKIESDDQSGSIIMRVCRMLALLGYNSYDEKLRANIREILLSLPRDDPRFGPHCGSSYVNMHTWEDVVDALQPFFPENCMEQFLVVRARDERRNVVAGKRMIGLRRIVFTEPREIVSSATVKVPAKAATKAPPTLSSADTTVLSATTILDHSTPEAAPVEHGKPGGGEPQELTDISDTQNDATVPSPDGDDNGDDNDDNDEQDQGIISLISEEKLAAARSIARVYRSLLVKRRQEVAETEISRCFSTCLARYQAKNSKVMHGLYRPYFLGSLPHILLSLERLFAYAASAKEEAKKRYLKAKGEEQKAWIERLMKVTRLVRDTTRLRKELGVQSTLHIKGDLQAFEKHVTEVSQLAEKYDIPKDVSQQWREDLRLGAMAFVHA